MSFIEIHKTNLKILKHTQLLIVDTAHPLLLPQKEPHVTALAFTSSWGLS
ncbi:hypothetical protein HanRHA438_Chr04g0186361 [Helianthus annuus]|nr:hypothetical protein HanRHA438_Chr04g0186361 [Helianthus annuus]